MACDSLCVWPILSAIDRELVKKAKYFAILDDGSNAILITHDKEAYGIGTNGDHGPLGLGTPESFFYAAKIKIFSGEGTYIACKFLYNKLLIQFNFRDYFACWS